MEELTDRNDNVSNSSSNAMEQIPQYLESVTYFWALGWKGPIDKLDWTLSTIANAIFYKLQEPLTYVTEHG